MHALLLMYSPSVVYVYRHTCDAQVPIIGLVMGERGLISRVLSAKFGGYLTFGTHETVAPPGEPTIKDLLNLYNFRSIGTETKVYGVISNPVSHSKSPFLYNEAFKSVGFNGVYLHLLVDNIAKFLQVYSSSDFAGFRFYLLLGGPLLSSYITYLRFALECICFNFTYMISISVVEFLTRRLQLSAVMRSTLWLG